MATEMRKTGVDVIGDIPFNGIDAMKETSGGSELTIKSKADDGQLLISVSDTGLGLLPGQSDLIFSAFFTTKDNGTGMGLPIPSVARSSSLMADTCGPPVLRGRAQLFCSRCLPRLRRTHNLSICAGWSVVSELARPLLPC